MGDWAEQRLAQAIVQACPGWKVSRYVETNRIPAADPGFRQSYLATLECTRRYGKRPDLLVFPATLPVEEDLSSRSQHETEPLVKKAIAAIEVRSSKFEALTYMAVRRRQQAMRKVSGRRAPSFTVKAEDLVIVYR
jgi:hypothetical protein